MTKLFAGLRPLTASGALRDVVAGLCVAAVNIPQVLGYARIAGAPVVTGLYTLLAPLIAFATFGSSRHLVVAADSATAAIFSGSLSPKAAPGDRASPRPSARHASMPRCTRPWRWRRAAARPRACSTPPRRRARSAGS